MVKNMNYTGLKADKILLPNTQDLTAWACIACDQFTSENEYWNALKEQVSGKPTTLDLVLPEIYLNDNPEKRIEKIRGAFLERRENEKQQLKAERLRRKQERKAGRAADNEPDEN